MGIIVKLIEAALLLICTFCRHLVGASGKKLIVPLRITIMELYILLQHSLPLKRILLSINYLL